MFITQITSYDNGWATFRSEYPKLAMDLLQAIDAIKPLIPEDPSARDDRHFTSPRRVMDEIFSAELERCEWVMINHRNARVKSSSLSIRGVGLVKQSIAVRFHYHREIFNRWLYTIAPLAAKQGTVTLPIAVMLAARVPTKFESPMTLSSERITEELLALQPLSYNGPFVIIGVGYEQQDIVITELTSNNTHQAKDVIINRSLEFPPEHHQAGLGILSYFGTILRDKYPDTKSKVRIEQEGLIVRLIIESGDGNREIIEKALEDYESVVRGEKKPEDFLDDKLKIIELKQELRFAELRIHQQADMIQFHREQVLTLTALIGHSLSRTPPSVNIEFKPCISLNSNVSNVMDVSLPEVLDELSNLSALSSGEPALQLKILDLQDSLEQLDDTTSPADARTSSGLKKLKAFVENASETGTSANNLLKVVEGGIDTLQSLARKYNSLAEWCGAPQVPRYFTGKEE